MSCRVSACARVSRVRSFVRRVTRRCARVIRDGRSRANRSIDRSIDRSIVERARARASIDRSFGVSDDDDGGGDDADDDGGARARGREREATDGGERRARTRGTRRRAGEADGDARGVLGRRGWGREQ